MLIYFENIINKKPLVYLTYFLFLHVWKGLYIKTRVLDNNLDRLLSDVVYFKVHTLYTYHKFML